MRRVPFSVHKQGGPLVASPFKYESSGRLNAASHMGGVWERLIRSVRPVFTAVVRNTVLSDGPLTPRQLLAVDCTGNMPPSVSSGEEQYRRHWAYIQCLTTRFWRRWTREYLPTIQFWQQWVANTANAKVAPSSSCSKVGFVQSPH